MITGIKIDFKEDNNNGFEKFENEWNDNIDPNILILSLLETVNDICKDNDLDTNAYLEKYIQMGSVDNYIE